jgi:type VI secretion system FHA domain protein
MILTLEVSGPQAQEMGASARKVFKAIGGTIGRLPDNDWVLPDPYVSGRHALIRYVNTRFFVEDTSTNGVFINSPQNRLVRGQPQQLHDGDVLFIDAYQINVSIRSEAQSSAQDPFALLKADGTKLVPPAHRAPAQPAAEQTREDSTASLAVLRVRDERNHTVVLAADDEEDDQSEDEHETEWFGGAEMVDPRKSLPARPKLVQSTVASPPPQPVRRPAVPLASTAAGSSVATQRLEKHSTSPERDLLNVLLDAAGIEGLTPSEEAARTLGQILRIALGGVMEALRTRERMKDDLRIPGTSFKVADNNPLKFSANVDDAFHNLLVKHNPAYLSPADACQEAFRDVRDHQAAFHAAMRLAFESMLAQFDPLRMQEEFDRQMKGAIIGVPGKLRYWDLYRDRYGELIKDAEAGFRTLFAEAFAQAYEEQLQRLRNSRPLGQ